MSKAPYPGYPPLYQVVEKTGGYVRTCLVIELLSEIALEPAHITHIQEQLEATLSKTTATIVEKSKVVTPDCFDTDLRRGLRLS